jgi:hypothetical protein
VDLVLIRAWIFIAEAFLHPLANALKKAWPREELLRR